MGRARIGWLAPLALVCACAAASREENQTIIFARPQTCDAGGFSPHCQSRLAARERQRIERLLHEACKRAIDIESSRFDPSTCVRRLQFVAAARDGLMRARSALSKDDPVAPLGLLAWSSAELEDSGLGKVCSNLLRRGENLQLLGGVDALTRASTCVVRGKSFAAAAVQSMFQLPPLPELATNSSPAPKKRATTVARKTLSAAERRKRFEERAWESDAPSPTPVATPLPQVQHILDLVSESVDSLQVACSHWRRFTGQSKMRARRTHATGAHPYRPLPPSLDDGSAHTPVLAPSKPVRRRPRKALSDRLMQPFAAGGAMELVGIGEHSCVVLQSACQDGIPRMLGASHAESERVREHLASLGGVSLRLWRVLQDKACDALKFVNAPSAMDLGLGTESSELVGVLTDLRNRIHG
jgi:hypothetical protein